MASEPGAPTSVPDGEDIMLPGRGRTYVRQLPGPVGAPVLALLHGWTATAALNWFPSFAPLARHFRVIALDHRGHGRGIRSRRPFSLEDCADDVAALAEVLDIPRLIPVGYSMGGPIAQLTWRRHRELVEGLVLCATARRFSGGRPADRMMASSMLGLSLAAALSPVAVQRRAMTRIVSNRLDGTPLSQWAARELNRNQPAALLRAGAALTTYDARGWISEVDVPTAVVVTEADRVVAPSSQLRLARAIADARVFGVHGDHGVCVAAPRRFVPVLVSACQDVGGRAELRRVASR